MSAARHSWTRRLAASLAVLALLAAGRAEAEAISYMGADGGDWDTAANWDTESVPTANDDVVIDGKWVRSSGSISAKSILIKGTAGYLTIAGTTKSVDAPTAVADRTAAVSLVVTGDIVLNGGRLSLGARDADYNVSAAIGGDLIVTNAAVAGFFAGKTDGVNATNQVDTITRLWANVNVITVSGTFRVGKGSSVYHENQRLTGTPILFKVRNFVQEAGGTNTSKGRGWGLVRYATGTTPPKGAVNDTCDSSGGSRQWFTYALGAGNSYNWGPGYGAKSGAAGYVWKQVVLDDIGTLGGVNFPCGYTYGYASAPFLPGSPNGTYGDSVRGGGAICIWAMENIEIAGSLTACGVNASYGGSSGGSIWLSGKRFSVARTASLTCNGGSSNYSSRGGAGRIAFSVGLTEAQLNACAAGTTPEELHDVPLYGCALVDSWVGTAGSWQTKNGTTRLIYAGGTVPYEVAATPTEYSTATPAYGFHAKPAAELPSAFTTAETSVYPEFYRNFRRFAHDGIVISNSTTTISIAEMASQTDPLRVIHQWTKIEDLLRLKIVGGGKVSVAENEYSADADIWLTKDTVISPEARAGTGAFVKWYGDMAGATSADAALSSMTLQPGMTLWAVFSDAVGQAKSFTGTDWSHWDVAENWSPAGVPSPLDDVTLTSKKLRAYGLVAVKSLTLSAATLAIGGEATDTTAETKPTSAVINDCGLLVSGNLAMTGASGLSLGASRQVAPIVASSVGGDVSLAGKSTMTVYARAYDGALGTDGKIPLTSYYNSAMSFAIGGKLTLSDTATVYPECDIVTGNSVRFDVTGDVSIGASASFSASMRGWGWINYVTEGYTDPRYRTAEGNYYTLCPGYGNSWSVGGAYGGGNATAPRMKYGLIYAPYLSGSTDGAYSVCRGAGCVWIKTKGTLDLQGKIYANGGTGSGTSSKSSGGGIWLIAKKISAGTSAFLQATGGSGGNGSGASGCGGRISLAIGLSDDDLDSLAVGEMPDTLTYSDTISLVKAEAKGANSTYNSDTGLYNKAPDGTLSTVTGEVSEYPMEIASSPVACLSENLSYATTNVEKGKVWSITIGNYGYDPSNPRNVRYTCDRWVISNSVGKVASGTGSTASFTPDKGPFSLTWLWKDREVCYRVPAVEGAKLTVDGVEASGEITAWKAESAQPVIGVVPNEGYEFLCWEGDVPFGLSTANPITLPSGKVRALTAVVRPVAEATTRVFKGANSKTVMVWKDPLAWTPNGIPGPNDDLVVCGSGMLLVSNYLACASLTLSNSVTLSVASSASSLQEEATLIVQGDLLMTNSAALTVASRNYYRHGRLAVGGDLILADANTLTVSAGPTNSTEFTFAKGAGWVTVGGDFTVGGTSKVVPNSEPWTGGSVVFTVGRDFTLGAKAAFKAYANGYQRVSSRNPVTYAPGAGYYYYIGAGHGGYGAGNRWGGYGNRYDFEYAPVQPGSPIGHYGDRPGGGAIRVHAGHDVVIAGRADASAKENDTDSSGSSGGSVWITAGRKLEVFSGAVLKARGGYRITGTGAPGGGGRIALAKNLADADRDALARTGTVAAWRYFAKRVKTEEFLSAHEGVTIDVKGGENYTGEQLGTFQFLDGSYPGLMLIVR